MDEELDVPVCLQMRPGEATKQLESVLARFPGVRVYPELAGRYD